MGTRLYYCFRHTFWIPIAVEGDGALKSPGEVHRQHEFTQLGEVDLFGTLRLAVRLALQVRLQGVSNSIDRVHHVRRFVPGQHARV